MTNPEVRPLYISEHVPKTGGTSLRRFFATVFPQESVYYYYHNKLLNAAENVSPVMKHPFLAVIKTNLCSNAIGSKIYQMIRHTLPEQNIRDEIKLPCTIIHGHHAARDFAARYPDAKLVTVIREPFSRALSHYYYVHQMHMAGQQTPEWAIGNESDPLEEFLLAAETANFQSRYITPYGLQNFAIVGVTETLDRFCQQFDPNRLPDRLNVTKKPSLPVNEAIFQQFKEMNHDDFVLYERAKEIAGRIL